MKKILSLMATFGLVVPSAVSVISCGQPNTASTGDELTIEDVNFVIHDIINQGELDWTGASYGDAEVGDWAELVSGLTNFWIDVKVSAVFIQTLLERIPSLYEKFPHFVLLAQTNTEFNSTTSDDKTRFQAEDIFWQTSRASSNEVSFYAHIHWSFDDYSNFNVLDNMIKLEAERESIFSNGITWTYDEILERYLSRSIFEWGKNSIRYSIFQYHSWNKVLDPRRYNDNFLKILSPNLKKVESLNSFKVKFKFSSQNNRFDKLKNFINDLKLIKTFDYKGDVFNQLLVFYLLNGYETDDENIKNIKIKLSDFPEKNYLQSLKNNENFKVLKNNLKNRFIGLINIRFLLENDEHIEKRLFDEIKLDLKIKDLIYPEDFNVKTQTGKINSVVFGNHIKTASGVTEWKNYESGLLILEWDLTFVQKDAVGNVIAQIPYSFDSQSYIKYI